MPDINIKSDIGLIAQAVAAIANVIAEFQKSAMVRKMQAAIEAGEKYIQTNENKSLDDKMRTKLLNKYKTRFFKYN